MRASSQKVSALPVDELLRRIREDVEAVVRAELQASLASLGRAREEFASVSTSPVLSGEDDPPLAPRDSGGRIQGSSLRLKSPDRGGAEAPLLSTELSPGTRGARRRRDSELSMTSVSMGDNLFLFGGVEKTTDPRNSTAPAPYELISGDNKDTFESYGRAMVGGDMNCCATRTLQCLDAAWSVREARRTGRLADLVQGNLFQTFFACVIAVNAGVMVYTVNQEMKNLHSPDAGAPPWVDTADTCFLVLYCVELCCKLALHRLYYFWNEDMAWNWLDFLLIMQSLVESVISLQGGAAGRGATWMRTIRLFRVAKVLRILRFVKFFTQLHLIMSAIVGSILHLFWSLMVFLILFLMFSLYFVSAVATYLQSTGKDAPDDDAVQLLMKYFGSVQSCMATLFMSLSGGDDWSVFYDCLSPISFAGAVFMLFVAFSQVALLNIVTGIFIENALKLSEPDVHQKAEEQSQRDQLYAKELKKLFLLADKDGSNLLSKEEFRCILENGRLGNFFRFLGIDPVWTRRNLPLMFDRMVEQQRNDSVDGGTDLPGPDKVQVDPNTFVEKCMALRGHARSTDVMELQTMILQIQNMQEMIMEQIREKENSPREHDSLVGKRSCN